MNEEVSTLDIHAAENESVDLVSTPVNTIQQGKDEENQVKVVISTDLHKKIQEKINITYEKDVDDSIRRVILVVKQGIFGGYFTNLIVGFNHFSFFSGILRY